MSSNPTTSPTSATDANGPDPTINRAYNATIPRFAAAVNNIDNVNIRPSNRNRVFRQRREFLHDCLGVEDRVMLVS